MGSVRIGRINDELMRHLSELIRTVRDPRVSGGLVSILRVETAPDLSSARVFVSVLGDETKRRDCVRGLRSATGYLRREAAKKLNLRYTPELTFIADDSITSGTHIMELIDNVSKRDDEKRKLTVSGAAEFLNSRDDILIITHKSPDGDTTGSACALAEALRSLGKAAYLFPNPDFSGRLLRRAKSFFAPEGFEPKYVIAVDIADVKLLSKESEEYAERIDLAIDHHITHKPFSRRALVVAEAAACGEIIFDILKELPVKFTKKIANFLYLAISTDTGRFLHTNTTPETHIKAAELLKCGAESEKINREFFVEKSKSRIALEAEIFSNMELFFGGKACVIKLSRECIEKNKATEDDLEGISALARSVKGVSLGVYIHERDGMAKVSLRSDDKVDCASVCANFGGGGHERAAGCTLDCSLDEASERIIAYIEELKLF